MAPGAHNKNKVVALKEVAEHKAKDNCWFVIDGKVYDITGFLDEHPGGDEILLESAGRDATKAFDDVGHSDDAKKQLDDLLVGVLSEEDAKSSKANLRSAAVTSTAAANQKGAQKEEGSMLLTALLPLGCLLLAAGYRYFMKQSDAAKQ